MLKIDYVNKSFYKNNNEQLPNIEFYKSLIEQINTGQNTYLHCHHGKHRTGFVVAMYQKSKGVDIDTIKQQLMECNWEIELQKRNIKIFLDKFLK